MIVRALQPAQVNTSKGLVYLAGPTYVEQEGGQQQIVSPGEHAHVADNFVVNAEVFEVVVPIPGKPQIAGKPPEFEVLSPSDPRAKGIKWTNLPRKREAEKTESPAGAGS